MHYYTGKTYMKKMHTTHITLTNFYKILIRVNSHKASALETKLYFYKNFDCTINQP